MRQIDKKKITFKDWEIITFCCVRNEILRLPYFLEYHRKLGVDRFIFVDNASTDGTTEFLLNQKGVHVFYTEESYAESHCGIDWLNKLQSEYGVNHWTLSLDADELFTYPRCEYINLKILTRYLDTEGTQAMKIFLFDMYSDKPISETHYKQGEPFLNYCNYFDSDSYFNYFGDQLPISGGPRYRLFWKDKNEEHSPCMFNFPLVKWRKDLFYESGRHVISNVKLGKMIGGIMHFKLFSDFYSNAEIESSRKEHWNDASEYKAYWDALEKNPDLSAMYSGSQKYVDSIQMVDLDLMRSPDGFEEHIKLPLIKLIQSQKYY